MQSGGNYIEKKYTETLWDIVGIKINIGSEIYKRFRACKT